jgi:O-acetyl-ADP-ribose deacetylase (regulator of RNase III)
VIQVVLDDITRLHVDAIVNAANSRLSGGGGVDGAIHRAAGPRLPTGQARITGGFDLPARWVIHTVGPVWTGGQSGEAGLLASCYRASCQLALEHDVRTIAFPAISTGVYGYPKAEATRIALNCLRDYQSRFERIMICCFSDADRDLYEALLD